MSKKLQDWLDEFVKNGADAADVTLWPENVGGNNDSLVTDYTNSYYVNQDKLIEIIDELQIAEWPEVFNHEREPVAEIGYVLDANIPPSTSPMVEIYAIQKMSGAVIMAKKWEISDGGGGSSWEIDYDETKTLAQLLQESGEEVYCYVDGTTDGTAMIGAARKVDPYDSANPYTVTFDISDFLEEMVTIDDTPGDTGTLN